MKNSFFVILAVCLFFPGAVLFSQEGRALPYPPQAVINAAYMEDIPLLEAILATDFDKDYRDALGGTALHIAILKNNTEVIRLLLDNGFDINAISKFNGYTPLHYCVWTNHPESARLLLLYGADKTIKDSSGQTPLDMARGNRDMLLVLSR